MCIFDSIGHRISFYGEVHILAADFVKQAAGT
jgi:hypothetical protein